MGSILSILATAGKFVWGIFAGNNTPDEVAAKKAANTQADKDRITADVAKGDVSAIEKDIS